MVKPTTDLTKLMKLSDALIEVQVVHPWISYWSIHRWLLGKLVPCVRIKTRRDGRYARFMVKPVDIFAFLEKCKQDSKQLEIAAEQKGKSYASIQKEIV